MNPTFITLVLAVLNVIGVLIPIVATLAFLMFLWGIAKFILNNANTKAHDEGKQFMLWSVIALFVMVTLFGIISFMKNEFNFSNGVLLPQLPISGPKTPN